MSSDSDSDISQDFAPPKGNLKPIKSKLSKKALSSSLTQLNRSNNKLNKIKEENSNFMTSQTSMHPDDKNNTRSLFYDPKLVCIFSHFQFLIQWLNQG